MGHLPDRPRLADLVDRVSIICLISTPIRRGSSHPRVTVGRRRAYPIRLRGKSRRRALWVSRRTRWINLLERRRGRTCRLPYRVRILFSTLFFSLSLFLSRKVQGHEEVCVGWARVYSAIRPSLVHPQAMALLRHMP